MKKLALLAAATATAASLRAAAPLIDQTTVKMSQDRYTRDVTITYRLTGGPAIVTVDIQTNVTGQATANEEDWLSIGEDKFRDATGDVNLLIQPSAADDKVIRWNPKDNAPTLKAKHESCRAVVKAWAEDAPPDYLVVDLRRDNNRAATDPRIRYYVSTNAFPEADNVQNDIYRTDFMVMRLIKARGESFNMGSPDGESGRVSNELLHNVTFSQPDFYCAVYPITIGQFLNFGYWAVRDNAGITDLQIDGTTAFGIGTLYQNQTVADQVLSGYLTNHVAACFKYHNARGSENWPSSGHSVGSGSLCSALRNRTGVEFDLPTEAQWEFCARAGTTTARYIDNVFEIAWIDSSNPDGFGKVNRPVGMLKPNAWGLYDMLGTLWECCLDWYAADIGTDPVMDPVGPESGSSGRSIRAGCYAYAHTFARAARRFGSSNTFCVENGFSGGRFVAPVGLKWPTAPDNRMLTVEYSLTTNTIVTVDVQTNRTGEATGDAADWVSIGEENFTGVFGDVNCLVSSGAVKKVYWRADASWPNHYFANGAIRMVVKKWDASNPPDYLVIDLSGTKGTRERYYVSEKALPYGGVTNRLYKYQLMAMRRIPIQGTKWCMGSPVGETGVTQWDSETQHYVTFLEEDFYCAVYPVTCGQLSLFDSTMPLSGWNSWSQFYDKNLVAYTATPMRWWTMVRGEQAVADWPNDGHAVSPDSYLGKLSALVGGRDFDIPTESQWEFFCRAGSSASIYIWPPADGGWLDSNSGRVAHEVGLKKPNAWGIYELIGGLWEMTLDWYAPMTADPVTDPKGPTSGDSRVWRGGNGSYAWTYARSASRYGGDVSFCCGLYGQFRPVTPISGKWKESK